MGDLLFSRAKSWTVVAVSAVLLTGACGSQEDPQPTVDSQGSTSASPSQTAPTAEEPSQSTPKTDEPLQTEFPDIGLEFTDIPDVSGFEREALKTYIDFVRGLEETGRSDKIKVSPLLKKTALPDLLSSFEGSFTYLRENNKHFAGERRVTISVAASKGQLVAFDRCDDLTKVIMVTDGKSARATDDDTALSHGVLTNVSGKWFVTEDDLDDESC